MAKEHKTNTEFITELMEFGCPTGALIQPFIIEALASYSHRVTQLGPDHFDSPLISGEAWVATAKHVKKSIDDRSN